MSVSFFGTQSISNKLKKGSNFWDGTSVHIVPAPFDVFGAGKGGYSIRRLYTSYVGSPLRVRRSSDSTEQDIGFDVDGNLDQAALLSFVGVSDGYVVKWYDQSGNGLDCVQSTLSYQPRIVSSGSVLILNYKPIITFDGVDDFFVITGKFTSKDITSSWVGNRTASGANHVMYDNSDDASFGGSYHMRFTSTNVARVWVQNATYNTAYGSYTTAAQRIISHVAQITGGIDYNYLRVDGTQVASNSGATYLRLEKATTRVGHSELLGGYFSGGMQELMVWDTYLDTDIVNIEANINMYYAHH